MLLSAQFGLFCYLLNFVYKSSSLFPLHDGSADSVVSLCECKYFTLPLRPRFPTYFLPAPSYLHLHGFTFLL